jgi:hypothetical protein
LLFYNCAGSNPQAQLFFIFPASRFLTFIARFAAFSTSERRILVWDLGTFQKTRPLQPANEQRDNCRRVLLLATLAEGVLIEKYFRDRVIIPLKRILFSAEDA